MKWSQLQATNNSLVYAVPALKELEPVGSCGMTKKVWVTGLLET